MTWFQRVHAVEGYNQDKRSSRGFWFKQGNTSHTARQQKTLEESVIALEDERYKRIITLWP